MTTRAPVLRLRGLRKTLGHPGGPERFELRVDRLDLAPGRLVAVIGPSGAGKSTLLDILALISAPDAAEAFSVATLADESDAAALWTAGDERGLSLLRRHVGLVLQSGGLAPFLDVAGNAAAARRLAGLPADPALIEALAEELELGRRLRARPATLSGGERQRAAILSALAREPKLLVADEPTAAVDRARGRAIVEALAAQVARRGAAGVLVSHDLELVGQVADEVYRMELSVSADGATVATCAPVADGAVAASGPTDQGARVPTAGPKAPSPRRRASGGGPFFPARLALLDLWRDARFTTAAVAGLAAVIAPLLVLLGLQIGVVAHEVERLTEDPRNRELTPLRAGLVTEARLDAWRAREDVAFVTPSIARGASAAAVRLADPGGAARDELMDVVATGEGDPLLMQNGAQAPRPGEAVLSHLAAGALTRGLAFDQAGGAAEALAGRRLRLVIARRVGGARQTETVELSIAGVLDPRADPLKRVYAPAAFVRAVEAYRAGARTGLTGVAAPRVAAPRVAEVSEAGDAAAALSPEETGDGRAPPARYDAILATAPEEGAAQGFTAAARAVGGAAPASPDDLMALFGGAFSAQPAGRAMAVLTAPGATFGPAHLNAAAAALGGDGAAGGVVSPRPGLLQLGGAPPRRVQFGALPLGVGPDLSVERTARAAIAAPLGLFDGAAVGAEGVARFEGGLEIPVRVAAATDGPVLLPLPLAAQLRGAEGATLSFDPAAGTFRQAETRFRGFRMYARSIHDVEKVHRDLDAEGIETVARLGPIRAVQEIETALTTLFALVASIAVTGAAVAMAANLASAVERKRADIAMLRVLGMSRAGAFAWPVTQALALALGGAAVAIALYLVVSAPVNRYLAATLPFGERAVSAPLAALGAAALFACGVAMGSALIAGRRAARLDPARCLRRE